MMTKNEQIVIQNIIDRLKTENCGCDNGAGTEAIVEAANNFGGSCGRMEVVSRLYLDSWVIPTLEKLLLGDGRNVDAALRLSEK